LHDDLLRLAVLRSVQDSELVPSSGGFKVTSVFEKEHGRLTLTSQPKETVVRPDSAAREAVRAALITGRLREIVWNHAPLGQYIALYFRPFRRSVSFDVGRNDTYGVYRFDHLVEAASEHPILVYEAIAPLLTTTSASDDISLGQ
jgi:hypothetical protein